MVTTAAGAARLILDLLSLEDSRRLLANADRRIFAAGLKPILRDRDTPSLYGWLMEVFSFQGISDAIAADYLARHGNAEWKEIDRRLRRTRPLCPKLSSFDAYRDCGFQKLKEQCNNPRLIASCPVPQLPLRKGQLNQLAFSLYLFIRDRAHGDLVGFIDDLSESPVPGQHQRFDWPRPGQAPRGVWPDLWGRPEACLDGLGEPAHCRRSVEARLAGTGSVIRRRRQPGPQFPSSDRHPFGLWPFPCLWPGLLWQGRLFGGSLQAGRRRSISSRSSREPPPTIPGFSNMSFGSSVPRPDLISAMATTSMIGRPANEPIARSVGDAQGCPSSLRPRAPAKLAPALPADGGEGSAGSRRSSLLRPSSKGPSTVSAASMR